MTYRLSTNSRNKACDALVDAIDVSSPGTLKVYTSTPPASVGGTYGTLLGTLTFAATAFGSSSSGTATAAAIVSDTSADASGTAGAFLIADGAGAAHSDGTCGQGSGDLSFDNNVIVAGGVIAVSSMTITVPIS